MREIVVEEVADGPSRMVPRRRVRHARILDWYRDRNLLSKDRNENLNLWWAGNVLSHQFEALQPKITSRYEEWVGSGSVESPMMLRGDAATQIRKALGHVEGRDTLMDVCCLDVPVGKERLPILREALAQLYDFYKLSKG